MSYDTNPAGKAATQVGDGPRKGNASYGGKRGVFIAAKDAFQKTATEITERYSERGNANRGYIAKDDDSIKPNVKMKRGPTKG